MGQMRVVHQAPFLVLNPIAASRVEQGAALALGEALRAVFTQIPFVAHSVVSSERLGLALEQFGYRLTDELSPSASVALAHSMAAPVVVTSTIMRRESGAHEIVARVVRTGFGLGQVVTVTQAPGQTLRSLAERVAKSVAPVIRAIPSAEECLSLARTAPEKARKIARTALKAVAHLSLAEVCLAEIGALEANDPAGIIEHYLNAAKGDPFAVIPHRRLLEWFQVIGDTLRATQEIQKLSLLAPTDPAVQKQSYDVLRKYGMIAESKALLEDGLRNAPSDTVMLQFVSHACLEASNVACAIDALERLVMVDSTRADPVPLLTTLSAFCSERHSPDCPALIERAAALFPRSDAFLGMLGVAYVLDGQSDSAAAVVARLTRQGTESGKAMLRIVRLTVEMKRPTEAAELAVFFAPLSDEMVRNEYAGLLVNAALEVVQGTAPSYEGAAVLAAAALSVSPTHARTIMIGNYLTGAAAFRQVVENSKATHSRQCGSGEAQGYLRLVASAMSSLTIAVQSEQENIRRFSTNALRVLLHEQRQMAHRGCH